MFQLIRQVLADTSLIQTKRIEDRAYNLMGLFDINMPIIYSEREKYFLRRQQHIIMKTKGESISAWHMELLDGIDVSSTTCSGLYAPSPAVFISSNDLIQKPGSRGVYVHNGELHLRRKVQNNFSTTRAILSCAKKGSPDEKILILLKELITDSMGQDAVRVRTKHSASQGTMRMPGEDIQ